MTEAEELLCGQCDPDRKVAKLVAIYRRRDLSWGEIEERVRPYSATLRHRAQAIVFGS